MREYISLDPQPDSGDFQTTDPFGSLIDPKWKEQILEGSQQGIPLFLNEYPFLVSETNIKKLHLIGKGLGSDVYAFNDYWVIKIAADRHPDAIASSYLKKQLESYCFLRENLGDKFVTTTFLFSCPIWGRQRGCAVQPLIHGKHLIKIEDREYRANSILRNNLIVFLNKILEVYKQTGRVPDLWNDARNSRYTKNIIIDWSFHPWLVDIGAWPEGFSIQGGMRAKIRVFKIVHDLRHFAKVLENISSRT